MRLVYASALAAAIALMISVANAAPRAQDPDRKVAGGGISAPGWMGAIDAAAAAKGGTINDSKFAAMGSDFHLTIGPAAFYWNPKNTATGNYTVSATFKELKPGMGGHPHPAGVFIAGANLDTDKKTAFYCTVNSAGAVLVRGFNEGTVFTLTTGRGGAAPNAAVAKPAADGTVTNTVAWNVKDGTAECMVNGTSVGSFTKDQHKIATDGIYGIRVSHNMEVMVSGLAKK
ncbi:MAG TPA: hypothetical protein VES67_00860 [Vicinamibacterales bacterium]|nr:hypothetical protein [Vicinamibacterales bacterium]